MSVLVLLIATAAPLTLEEVRAASRQNVDAMKAEFDLERAGQLVRGSKAAIYPQVNLSFSVSGAASGDQTFLNPITQSVMVQPGTTRANFNLGLTVNQLLYDGGRWWKQIAQAGAQQQASEGQLDEQRLSAELEATRRFYELVRAQLTSKVLEASVGRSKNQLARAQSLYEAGRVQRRDVLDAEVNLGNDQISVMRQEQAIVAAQIELLRWIGRSPSDVAAVAPNALEQATLDAAPDAERTLTAARERRPLLKVLREQAQAAELAVELASADFLPRVSGQLAYSRSGPSADPFFTDPTKQNAVSAGVSLSWDLFSGFGTEAAAGRARADLSSLKVSQAQAIIDLEAEIRRGVKTLDTSLAVAAVAEKIRALSTTEVELEDQRYSAGAGSSLDVRNAQVKLTQAQLTQVQARVDVEIARAALARSVGGPLEAAK